jgi:hypothetical protein
MEEFLESRKVLLYRDQDEQFNSVQYFHFISLYALLYYYVFLLDHLSSVSRKRNLTLLLKFSPLQLFPGRADSAHRLVYLLYSLYLQLPTENEHDC